MPRHPFLALAAPMPMRRAAPGVILSLLLVMPAQAGWLEVQVTGIPDDQGTLACSLHADPSGFPGGVGVASQRVRHGGGRGLCRFGDVAPGRYAVAVMQDANDNGRLDVNLLGLPVEAWGVSGPARPRLRAPRFDESAFRTDGAPASVTIELGR